MRKILSVICSFIIVFAFCSALAFHAQEVQAEDSFTISIKLSPETVVLDNKASGFCGIHTDIGYWAVDTSTLQLTNELGETINIDVAKADSYGNLIVMVSLEKVKLIVTPPDTILTLLGSTNGENPIPFSGSDIIRVK